MKNLYVYVLRGRTVEKKVMYDVVCKRNGDIIRREDNYYYSQHGYGKRRNGLSGTEEKENLDKFHVGCYHKRDGEKHDDWFVRYISYEEQTDLVKLKSNMIKAYQDYINERCQNRIKYIDNELERIYQEMITKRKACVQERDELQELAFKKFL